MPLPRLLAGGAVILALTCHPAAACRVAKRATVPLQRAGGLMLVPVEINGRTTPFVLDTGAERTVVGLAAADRIGLARDEWVSTDMTGAGGRDRRRLGRPASLSIGGVALRRHTVAADNSVVVGPIFDSVAGQPVTGLLGQDFLSAYDLDLDPAAGTLSLYDVTGCSGAFLPWAGRYDSIPAGRPVRNILTLPMTIDGHSLAAELDSGAEISVVTLPGMLAMNLQAGGTQAMHGFGVAGLPYRTQRFASVHVGRDSPGEQTLAVAPIRTLRSVGVLLGADWLSARHAWVSWATDQVFVAAR